MSNPPQFTGDDVYYDYTVGEFYRFEQPSEDDPAEVYGPYGERVETLGPDEFRDLTNDLVRVEDDAVEDPAEYLDHELAGILAGMAGDDLSLQYAYLMTNIVAADDTQDDSSGTDKMGYQNAPSEMYPDDPDDEPGTEYHVGRQCRAAAERNADDWQDFLDHEDGALNFLVGQVMQQVGGSLNPADVATEFKHIRDMAEGTNPPETTPVDARLEIAGDDDVMERVMAAEEALREAGVTFDTGMRLPAPVDDERAFDGDNPVREWHLDFSLEGADLVEVGQSTEDAPDELQSVARSLLAMERDRELGYPSDELHRDPKEAIREAVRVLEAHGDQRDELILPDDQPHFFDVDEEADDD